MKKNNFILRVTPGSKLHGHVHVPGDKSISHRAIMLGAIANGMNKLPTYKQYRCYAKTPNSKCLPQVPAKLSVFQFKI
ncbi:hypothetical protein TI03_03530, partial [Achromatium sp. WMS1]